MRFQLFNGASHITANMKRMNRERRYRRMLYFMARNRIFLVGGIILLPFVLLFRERKGQEISILAAAALPTLTVAIA